MSFDLCGVAMAPGYVSGEAKRKFQQIQEAYLGNCWLGLVLYYAFQVFDEFVIFISNFM